MKTVGAFDAKTNLSKMLAQVARGETFLITRRGKPVAALSPVAAATKPDFRETIDRFRDRFATSSKKITFKEIAEFKEAGRP